MHSVVFVLLRRIHLPLIVLICVYATSILGFVLIPGVDPQGNPWRMDFFHAFYFVSFMGTTIGFGEIPYPFTELQRMWTTIAIYGTVTAWLFSIGSLLSLIQDPVFQSLIKESAFRRAIRRLHEPFYLICGYGDTGSLLVQALTEANIRAVVIDIDQERINNLEVETLRLYVPGICGDASVPDVLLKAGLKSTWCSGIVALTNIDHVNLKISISSKLLNPGLQTISRAETHDAEKNIASFGTEQIINPFDTFAERLAMALHSPGMYLLHEWMTAVPHEPLCKAQFPPHGRWVLCGYGRFGKAVHERLTAEGMPTTVIEATPTKTGELPERSVIGRGTEAVTLKQADIENAVGIVAGTDDDANNLSIIMTAHDLNKNLFMVARQNLSQNDSIFQAAHLDLIMQRASIIAHKIYALIITPLLGDFIKIARQQTNDWANQVLSSIAGLTDDEAPFTWMLHISINDSPTLFAWIKQNNIITVKDLKRDPRNREKRMPCIVLYIKRGMHELLAPEDNTTLKIGDKILFCGQLRAKKYTNWVASNYNVFEYIVTGEQNSHNFLLKKIKSVLIKSQSNQT